MLDTADIVRDGDVPTLRLRNGGTSEHAAANGCNLLTLDLPYRSSFPTLAIDTLLSPRIRIWVTVDRPWEQSTIKVRGAINMKRSFLNIG